MSRPSAACPPLSVARAVAAMLLKPAMSRREDVMDPFADGTTQWRSELPVIAVWHT